VGQAEAKATRLIIIIIAALHAALALTFPLVFFTLALVTDDKPAAPPGNSTLPATTAPAFMLW
jgi:hypothetical protein